MGIINLSINLDKIDKTKIINGKKGKYLNLTIAENRDGEDQYGNTHYSFISQSKEEREAKQERVYLGNGKEFNFDNNNSTPKAKAAPVPVAEDFNLPF